MQRFLRGKMDVGRCHSVGWRLYTSTRDKDTLTLNLDKALEIALSDNPTIKVAEEEIALKKVSHKETWQNLLPEASISGTMSHTITAPQFSIGDQTVKWVRIRRIRLPEH